MKACYKCGATLTKDNQSDEHIIPNLFGGLETSRDLLCKKCNSDFGNTIDAELYAQLGQFADMIVTIRDRQKKKVKISIQTASGQKMQVGKALIPKFKVTIKVPDKEDPVVLFAENEAEARKLLQQKQKELQKKYKNAEFVTTENQEEPLKEPYYFKNAEDAAPGEIVLGGRNFYRGIAKIILNFYLTKIPDGKPPQRLLDYVNGKGVETPVSIYHPSHYEVCKSEPGEFSHVLHLKGDKTERMVYGYLELFNAEKYLCVIHLDYDGPDFEISYCLDLATGKQITKDIKVQITRSHLEDLKFIAESHKPKREKVFSQLLKRIESLQTSDGTAR